LNTIKLSGYRWIVLIALMMITIMSSIQWLTHAPVARPAEVFYEGHFDPSSFFNIDFLASSYMFFYLVFSIPASYMIDTHGIVKGIGTGAILTAAGGIIKGMSGTSFYMVMAGQILLAIGQPFIINSATAVSARWFPVKERALATGLATLAQYLGILIAMLVTPMLVVSSPSDPAYGSGIDKMLKIYGVITVVFALSGMFLLKEKPDTPPAKEEYLRTSFSDGLKRILRLRDMWLMIVLFTIGLGIFNAISSMVDAITAYIGVDDSNGMIGGLMLIGGIIGAIIIPILSDYYRKRKLFLVICVMGTVPGVAGLAFAPAISDILGLSHGNTYILALVSSFVLGFFVMSAGPIGFQYAAEVSAPAPESTSQGLLLWVGQISGIIMVTGMSMRNKLYVNAFMVSFVILIIIAAVLIKESRIIISER
jgi:MFS family permease